MRIVAIALVLLSAGPLPAAEPPRNQLPHQPKPAPPFEDVEAELRQLRRTVQAQQMQIDALREQAAALERDLLRARPNRRELAGSWKVLSVEEDGEARPKTVARLVFGARSLTFHDQEPSRERAYAYKLDPAEEPREIDVFGGGSRPTAGIYELKGDRLTICIDRQLAARPTEFVSRPGSGTTLWTLEREEPHPAPLESNPSPAAAPSAAAAP